jgi:hypothetical protein
VGIREPSIVCGYCNVGVSKEVEGTPDAEAVDREDDRHVDEVSGAERQGLTHVCGRPDTSLKVFDVCAGAEGAPSTREDDAADGRIVVNGLPAFFELVLECSA